jgi:hypothetical protein
VTSAGQPNTGANPHTPFGRTYKEYFDKQTSYSAPRHPRIGHHDPSPDLLCEFSTGKTGSGTMNLRRWKYAY